MAKSNEDTNQFPALADAVASIAGKSVTTGQIKLRTGLNRMTALKLINGNSVTEATIERFARGYGVPTNPLRLAIGLEPLPIDPTSHTNDIDSKQFEVNLPDGKSVVVAGLRFRRDDQEILTKLIRRFAETAESD